MIPLPSLVTEVFIQNSFDWQIFSLTVQSTLAQHGNGWDSVLHGSFHHHESARDHRASRAAPRAGHWWHLVRPARVLPRELRCRVNTPRQGQGHHILPQRCPQLYGQGQCSISYVFNVSWTKSKLFPRIKGNVLSGN